MTLTELALQWRKSAATPRDGTGYLDGMRDTYQSLAEELEDFIRAHEGEPIS